MSKPLAIILLLASGSCVYFPAALADNTGATLGRLFTTHEQRIKMQKLRMAPPVVAAAPAPAPVPEPEPQLVIPAPPPPEVPALRVDGFVVAPKGRGTVWLNDKNNTTADFSEEHVRVNPARIQRGTVLVETPEHLPDVRLKPGQTYDPASGSTTDVYLLPRVAADPGTTPPPTR